MAHFVEVDALLGAASPVGVSLPNGQVRQQLVKQRVWLNIDAIAFVIPGEQQKRPDQLVLAGGVPLALAEPFAHVVARANGEPVHDEPPPGSMRLLNGDSQ